MVSLLLFDRYIVTHLPSRRNSAILTNNRNQYGCRLYSSFRLWNLDDLCQWIISHWFIVLEKELSMYFCGSRNFHRKQMPSFLCWKAHFTNSSSFFFFLLLFFEVSKHESCFKRNSKSSMQSLCQNIFLSLVSFYS